MPAPKGHKKYGGGLKKGQKLKRTIEQEQTLQIIRQELIKDLKPIIQALREKCKEGNVQAIQEVLNRLVGKPKEQIDIGFSEEARQALEKVAKLLK